MSRAIADLLSKKPVDGPAIDDFMKDREFPIVEGSGVTFVFRGEAEGVFLHHWIFGLESAQPFDRVDGTDLWYRTEDVPGASRIEYKIEVRKNGDRSLLLDPLNPHLARDPFGANSVLRGAGYEEPEWTRPDPEARPGHIETLEMDSEALGGPRTVRVYLPARFTEHRRYPLLVAHDGDDYLRYSSLQTVLDNLIHRMEVTPMIVALSIPHARTTEYADHEPHARHLTEELVPMLEAKYPLVPEPTARGLMGASFGGVASLSTAWRYPGFYGRLLLQSGSYAFTDIGENHRGPLFEPVVAFMNEFRRNPGRPSQKLYVSCGMYESLIYENRSLVPLLQATGMNVKYEEARDGHNWENWRDRLRTGLSWLFPGRQWMIYE